MIRRVLILLTLLVGGAASGHAQSPFSGAASIEVTMTKLPAPESCIASEYGVGDRYHGRRAADGSIFNTHATTPYTVAHKTRRLGSYVTVTSIASGRSIRARVTDRGPYRGGRCVDLGRAGAAAIGMRGLARVTLR